MEQDTIYLCAREDRPDVHVIQIEDRIFEVLANSREAALAIAEEANRN